MKPESIDGYIAAQPEAVREKLERMRGILRKALPDAEEAISYSMPAFRMPKGRVIVYFAAWKNHLALYPGSGRVTEQLRDELTEYPVSKGAIRFPLEKPAPAKLIAKIAKLREAEEAERVKMR